MAKKLIPCRVCGKMFEPCAYCQEHSDTFRWRNFACSIECAKQYLANTLAYRESLKAESETAAKTVKKSSKKSSVKTEETIDTVIAVNETNTETSVDIEETKDEENITTNTEDETE